LVSKADVRLSGDKRDVIATTKERKGRTSRVHELGSAVVAGGEDSEEKTSSVIDLPDKARRISKSEKGLGICPDKLNQGRDCLRPELALGDYALAHLRKPSNEQLAVKPQQGVPPDDDEVSLLHKAYRAFWAGKLPDERIEEECRSIARLFP
jgi:hypothetical protein